MVMNHTAFLGTLYTRKWGTFARMVMIHSAFLGTLYTRKWSTFALMVIIHPILQTSDVEVYGKQPLIREAL